MLSLYHAEDFCKETFSNVSVYGHYKTQKKELKKQRKKALEQGQVLYQGTKCSRV